MVCRVVAQEAPIRDDLLVERVARAHGIARSGRIVRDRIVSVAERAALFRPEEGDLVFVWPDNAAPAAWTEARASATAADVRHIIKEIAVEELMAALRACVGEFSEIEAARFFGVCRLSAAARARLLAAKQKTGQ